ncbi:hypothetical protein LIER_01152 [Lithospermum erythrorhizon]|uniref:Uncharacterized protein n=1 Tax=Lithospermum erythrorhizon TaxID=34254 RepID=A0AAV3NKN2_LITER
MTDPEKGLEIAIKNELPDVEHRLSIMPPHIRVLPRRPQRNRTKGVAERRKEAEKQTSMKGEQADTGVFKASWKGAVIHCKIYGGVAHNVRTCPRKTVDEEVGGSPSQPTNAPSKSKKQKTRASSYQPSISIR